MLEGQAVLQSFDCHAGGSFPPTAAWTSEEGSKAAKQNKSVRWNFDLLRQRQATLRGPGKYFGSNPQERQEYTKPSRAGLLFLTPLRGEVCTLFAILEDGAD